MSGLHALSTYTARISHGKVVVTSGMVRMLNDNCEAKSDMKVLLVSKPLFPVVLFDH